MGETLPAARCVDDHQCVLLVPRAASPTADYIHLMPVLCRMWSYACRLPARFRSGFEGYIHVSLMLFAAGAPTPPLPPVNWATSRKVSKSRGR